MKMLEHTDGYIWMKEALSQTKDAACPDSKGKRKVGEV